METEILLRALEKLEDPAHIYMVSLSWCIKNYLWQNRKELLTRLINDYENTLKPKHFRTRYELRKFWQNYG